MRKFDKNEMNRVWDKGYVKNQGIPMHVCPQNDLKAKPKANPDSWYVISSFECEGEHLGFMWHQQINYLPNGMCIQTIEFLQMHAEENIWDNNSFLEPISEQSGVDSDRLHVFSSIGELAGNHEEMTLKLKVEEGALDVVMKPQKNVLYNGTTGLLKFLGSINSYEFAYPDMEIEGTFSLKGKEYKISSATAWFDRQWGDEFKPGAEGGEGAWLWLGMPLNVNKGTSISLWDSYNSDGRYAFATIIHEDGTQINVRADVTYTNIWKSKNTGHSYPYDIHISIPEEELELTLISVIGEPEFYREGSPIAGCQSYCKVSGKYKEDRVEEYAILEMVGDLGSRI